MYPLNSRVALARNSSPEPIPLKLLRFTGLTLLVYLFFSCFASDVQAQRAGDSATIRVGEVTGMRTVDLRDGNAVGGALVGGAVGAALSGSSSSSRSRNRNAAIGAILGTAAASSRRTEGRVYTVTTNNGTMVQVATEQTEIQIGDCVFIEESGGGTNIRRAPATACEPATQAMLRDDENIRTELQGDATVCFAARQELADAKDDAAFDLAVRKVKLLCYD
jgi:outer membrane lipoprotein SlyB